jgi:hypothetical protein
MFQNFLKPLGNFTYSKTRFNIQEFYMVITLSLCVLNGSQNNQQLCHYTTLTDLFLNSGGECLLRGTAWALI